MTSLANKKDELQILPQNLIKELFSNSFLEASIILISKHNKDIKKDYYRTILLMNTGKKKILNNTL